MAGSDNLKGSRKYVLLLGFILLVFLITMPFWSWYLKPAKTLDVLIFNKTVPGGDLREHKGLTWLLNQHKYVKSDGTAYDASIDYVGVYLDGGLYASRSLPADISSYDVIYIADTYGIYQEDVDGENIFGERSERIYGGLQPEELEHIKSALWDGATLIAEFNTFASPTSPQVRDDISNLLGLSWSGWIGRHFNDLQQGGEVPVWAISSYEEQYQEKWDFQGSGVLLVDEKDTVIVLEEGLHLGGAKVETVFNAAGQELFGFSRDVSYGYWFDIVASRENATVLAEYNLDLTTEGLKVINDAGLPQVFPAVIRNDTGIYTSYYYAGDYVDIINTPTMYKVNWLDRLQQFYTLGGLRSDEAFFYQAYVPMTNAILNIVWQNKEAAKTALTMADIELYQEEGISMTARTAGRLLQVYQDGEWRDFPVKGVNMGMAVPGRWFTEFPPSEEPYLRWFEMIGQMEANSVRVYTLQHPSFYRALSMYNKQNPQEPLWLFQEIWPEEHPPNDDLLAQEYQEAFEEEIRNVIDALHGQVEIEERQGRAWGNYHVDISPYVVGYLVGREIEPQEVESTNQRNLGFTYEGEFLSSAGSPSEAWLAMSCDYVLQYEQERYKRQTPVAIVSWPTLDAIDHDYALGEDGKPFIDFNDLVSVDIRNIKTSDSLKSGFFGAYHIYPNYPAFINHKPIYQEYSDEEGVFRYGGYLQEFMKYHGEYPALVAEFGLSTGMGNAHNNPDGYHHGGMTEVEQGEGVVRMMEAIFEEDYMGGLIFEWMDEWAKKTWTTEPFMIPYETNVYWHNAIDPEQNYGILANEPLPIKGPEMIIDQEGHYFSGSKIVDSIGLNANEAFFHTEISLSDDFNFDKHEIIIGIDTYSRERGQFSFPSSVGKEAASGMEFLVNLKSPKEVGKLLATPDYNMGAMKFSSQIRKDGVFTEIRPLINNALTLLDGTRIEEVREEASNLYYGDLTGSTNHWYIEDNALQLRLPWGRINVTDPVNHLVLDDPGSYNYYLERDGFQTAKTEGFVLYLLVLEKESGQVVQIVEQDTNTPYQWESWREPRYQERLKDSYYIIQDYFRSLKVAQD